MQRVRRNLGCDRTLSLKTRFKVRRDRSTTLQVHVLEEKAAIAARTRLMCRVSRLIASESLGTKFLSAAGSWIVVA
jgi:hypothetical protein